MAETFPSCLAVSIMKTPVILRTRTRVFIGHPREKKIDKSTLFMV